MLTPKRRAPAPLAPALVLVIAALGLHLTPARAVGPVALVPPDPVMVGAGDIASCTSPGDEATAALLDQISGTVFTLGDNVYPTGAPLTFAQCYGPSWGRHKARTRPAPGNHDFYYPGGAGYFAYFGASAGEPGKGYYSYDLGTWHVVVLNSNCDKVPCQAGSAQEQWLRADLATHPTTCTLAYWHHPRFSSDAGHGSNIAMAPFWHALYDFGADVVLSGHAHDYERFAPQDPWGAPALFFGLRQFVVGTGGASHYGFAPVPLPTSEVRNSATFGVLKLTLHPTSYDWRFIPQTGATFTDSGTGSCHGPPPALPALPRPPTPPAPVAPTTPARPPR